VAWQIIAFRFNVERSADVLVERLLAKAQSGRDALHGVQQGTDEPARQRPERHCGDEQSTAIATAWQSLEAGPI
jgi:hypothetical protein